jgi:hypothetical protein
MIQQGKISSSEGLELLNALQETGMKEKLPSSSISERFLRIRVSGDTHVKKVDVNIPLSLIKIASRFINMIPKEARDHMEEKGIDLSSINFEELVELMDKGLTDGKLVDVDIDDEKEGKMQVEIYVD